MPRPLPSQRTAAPKRRRARAVIAGSIAAAALIAGVSTVGVALTPGDDRVVGSVDGADVTHSEVRFYAGLVRTAADRGAAAGGTDAATLREAALDEIRHDRALLALGREYGLTDLDSFAELEAAADATNAQRADQVADGEIVYGLTEFSLDEFRSRTMSDLRTRLISAMTEDQGTGLAATDAQVEAYLTEHADEWAAAATTYQVTKLSIPADAGLDAAAVAELTALAGGLEQAAAAVPGASASPVVIHAEGRIADPAAAAPALSPDAIGQLRTLAPGGLTDPQTDRGGWAVYRLDEATVDTATALTTYATRIRAVLADERFDALLAERIDAQRIELPPTEWNAVNMEGITR